MITKVTCDACDRVQNAPSSRAGQDVPCRFCGDPICVPGVPKPTSAIGGWGEPRRIVVPRFGEAPPPAPGSSTTTTYRSSSSSSSSPSGPTSPGSTSENLFRTTSRTTVGTTSLRTSFETTSQPEDEESLSEEVEAPDGFGDPLTYDRSQRGQHSQPRPTLSPIGTPIMSSGRAVEEQAGRPRVLGHAPGAGANGLLEAIAPGLKSDSKTDQSATAALMLSVVGWVFCFPFSLVALYLVKKTKDHALVEGRDLPQIATVATVLALLNLGFTLLTCAANVQIN